MLDSKMENKFFCELTELIKLPVYKSTRMYQADISWLNNKVDEQQYLFSLTQLL